MRNDGRGHAKCDLQKVAVLATRKGDQQGEHGIPGHTHDRGPGGRQGVPTENARGPEKHATQPKNAKAEREDDVLENKRQLRATNGQVGTWAPPPIACGHRHRSRRATEMTLNSVEKTLERTGRTAEGQGAKTKTPPQRQYPAEQAITKMP